MDPSTDTISIKARRADLRIEDSKLMYYKRNFDPMTKKLIQEPNPTTVDLVSTKEIIAGLFSRGRTTEFSGNSCSFEQFIDHVAMRLNVVVWTMKSHLIFPDEKETGIQYDEQKWKYDHEANFGEGDFEIQEGVSITDALLDPLKGNIRYTLGCLKSCKYLQVGSMTEYFKNIKNNDALEKLIEATGRNPYRSEVVRGILDIQEPIASNNWIAGDWGYLFNDDPYTHEYVDGEEGCNVLYIGRAFFGVYYENQSPRTFKKALCRVYNWRFLDVAYADERVKEILEKNPNAQILPKPVYDKEKDYCDADELSEERFQDLIKKMVYNHRKYASTSLPSDSRATFRTTYNFDGTPCTPEKAQKGLCVMMDNPDFDPVGKFRNSIMQPPPSQGSN